MSQRIYRVGVVGLGGRGIAHGKGYAAHPRFKLVAGCDIDEKMGARFREQFPGVRTYSDYNEMFRQEKLDVLGLTTNSLVRAPVTEAAAAHGIRAVHAEKPLASSLQAADAMLAACRRAGALLMVYHQRRWWPLHVRMRQLIREGVLGKVCTVTLVGGGKRFGSVGTHYIDLVNFLVGSDYDWAQGHLSPEAVQDPRRRPLFDPGAWGTLVYKNGTRFFIDLSTELTTRPIITLTGTKGVAVYKEWEVAWAVHTHLPDTDITSTVSYGRPLQTLDDPLLSAGYAADEQMSVGLDELAAALDGKAALSSGGEHGRQALEAIVGFHYSEGSPVRFPLPATAHGLEVRMG